jgi:hypothetical protein
VAVVVGAVVEVDETTMGEEVCLPSEPMCTT